MSRIDETLAEMGAPNNIFTRTTYRVTHKLMYITLYTGVTVISVVTRKDKLAVTNALCVKVGVEPVVPPK